jgi:hypothetical protein
MYLYEISLINLEKEYDDARQTIRNLQASLENSKTVPAKPSEEVDIPRIKLKVDLAISHLKVVKEQTAFYLKLCEKYDVVKLLEELVNEWSNCECGNCRNALVKICTSWGFDPRPAPEL